MRAWPVVCGDSAMTNVRVDSAGLERTNTPIEVCPHITLPEMYQTNHFGEYEMPLAIECKECGEVHEFTLIVN